MTPAEAAALLTVAAAYDNRKPDADQSRAWAMALDGYRFTDCRDAIVAHYKATKEWLMPFDVITRVKRIRAERVRAFGALPPPPRHIDPDDTKALQAWEVDTIRRIADGELTTDAPQIEAGQRGPWDDGPSPALEAAEASARIREIRRGLAKRAPEPEQPSLDDLMPDEEADQ